LPESQLDRLRMALSDRYALERELGVGGMATVYLARDLKHDRSVAIKVMRPELGASLGSERFLREIQLASGLQHPHILPLYDSGAANGLLYYVMPYVEGESLQERLRREGQLPLEDAMQILREVADALGFAHSRNVVHRDVKPANILLHGGHAMVADFGIARAIEAAAGEQLTQTGIAIGTPAYMSPEQASADSKIDGRSDIYSLGCVFYEMLGGEPPHTGPSPQAILARQLSGEVRSLRPLRTTVTPALDHVIRRALARAAADRYPTAQEFAAAATAAVTAVTAAEGAEPQDAPRGWRRVGAVLGVAAVLGALAYSLWGVRGAVSAELGPGVAVFPFRPTSSGAGEWSEAVSDLLATALDGTPGVRVADPWSLWQSLRPERGARAQAPDPAEADRLARQAGAETYVLGSVLEAQGRLDLTARLYRAGGGDALQTFSLTAPAESLPALVQRLAVDVIQWIWRERSDSTPRVRDLEGYTTRVPASLKAYLGAKEAMRRGQVQQANSAIDRALALDSAFALALVEATVIKSWWQFMQGQSYGGLRELAERAQRHADSLSQRNQLRLTAIRASIETQGARAAGALSRIVQLDSTDFEAWSALAYTHQVYGWQYGKGPADAVAALERVIQLDPQYVPGLAARAWLAVATGDEGDLRRQLDRLSLADTTSMLVRGWQATIGAMLRDDASFPAFADSLAQRPREEWIAAERALRVTHPTRAESLLVRVSRSPGDAPIGAGEQARLRLARGRTALVDSGIAAGDYAGSNFYRTLQLLLVGASIIDLSDSLAGQRAVQALEQYIPVDSALAYFNNRPAWWGAWLLGAWHAQRGDTAAARRWHRVIGTFPAGGSPPEWRAALQSDLEARLAARRGDFDAALRWAGRAFEQWSIHTENQFEHGPEPQMRLHLALLLRAAGRPDSAEALLRSLVPPTTWMGYLTARAWYELGELAEDRRDYQAAAGWYDRALKLWRGGGDEIRDWRARAEQGLERVLRRIG
jgi:tetratricopeptide (TPR) repeat protein